MSPARYATIALAGAFLGCATPDLATESAAVVVADGGIPRRSTWSYWDRGGDLGTAWRAGTFDDSAWASGAGPLGYGETYLATTVGYGSSSSNKHITTYFRTQFTVRDPAAVRAMTGALLYDDGVVVYLNGQELARRGVPSPSTAATRAVGHEASPATYTTDDWDAGIPLLVAGTNTIAVEVHQQDPSSSDLVFDLGLTLEVAAPPPPPSSSGGVARRSIWAYWDRGPTELNYYGWSQTGWDDSAWARGAGPLGYGESYLGTTVGYGPSASNKHITTYFRTELTVEDPGLVDAMTLELMYDDGAIVYLNGQELVRRGLPSPSTATTLAAGHEAGNAYETIDVTWARGALRTGRNVLAVEIHQQTASSSDLVFDAALALGLAPAAPPEDITRRDTWSYWDRGGLSGTAWTSPAFADGGWATGAGSFGYGENYHGTTVGYGPSASSKYITTYFRKRFTIADPAAVTSMLGEVIYDDGIVVYLNGHEVQRLHMPAGTITPTTLAPGWETGNVYETYDWSAARGFLVAGTNVLAVEVHQASGSSSDLTFDLALTVNSTCATPPTGSWSGEAGSGFEGSGAGAEDRADVTWTLARTDGCVDRYEPSGTAYAIVGAHFCWDHTPDSAAIQPDDGWLIIDRSVSPPTYRMHGESRWSGYDTCTDPWTPGTIGSQWAGDLRGTVSGDVISGRVGTSSELTYWDFRRVGASFPAPAPCSEPSFDRWTSVSSEYHPWAGGTRATVTWRRVATTGCIDDFEPESGVAEYLPGDTDSPYAPCRSTSASPSSAPVGPEDGRLTIDRSTNPPTFELDGVTQWEGTETCTRQDGTLHITQDRPGGRWGDAEGAYQIVPFSGGIGPDTGNQSDWTLSRP